MGGRPLLLDNNGANRYFLKGLLLMGKLVKFFPFCQVRLLRVRLQPVQGLRAAQDGQA